jgi:hypothetical protein
LRHVSVPRGDRRGTQTFASQYGRIVQIDERGAVVELEIGERQRQTAAAQQRGEEPLAAADAKQISQPRRRLKIDACPFAVG